MIRVIALAAAVSPVTLVAGWWLLGVIRSAEPGETDIYDNEVSR